MPLSAAQKQARQDYLNYLANPTATGYLLITRLRKELEAELKRRMGETTEQIELMANEIVKKTVESAIFHANKEVKKITSTISKGDKGDKPVAGVDYPLPKDGRDGRDAEPPNDNKLLALIKPLIPKVKDARTPTKAELEKLISRSLAYWFESNPKHLTTKDDVIKIIEELDFSRLAQKFARTLESLPYREKLDYHLGLKNQPYQAQTQSGRIIVKGGGSSGGSGITVETPPEAPDGSITTFTVSAQPKWVDTEAGHYYEGYGYSYSAGAGTITLDLAPSKPTDSPAGYVRVII